MTQTPAATQTSTSTDPARRPRTVAWGTTIAGSTAVVLALLVGLTEIAGVSIPFRTAGPGAVVAVGLVILLAGLVVVIRTGRSERSAPVVPTPEPVAEASSAPTSSPPHVSSPAQSDVDPTARPDPAAPPSAANPGHSSH